MTVRTETPPWSKRKPAASTHRMDIFWSCTDDPERKFLRNFFGVDKLTLAEDMINEADVMGEWVEDEPNYDKGDSAFDPKGFAKYMEDYYDGLLDKEYDKFLQKMVSVNTGISPPRKQSKAREQRQRAPIKTLRDIYVSNFSESREPTSYDLAAEQKIDAMFTKDAMEKVSFVLCRWPRPSELGRIVGAMISGGGSADAAKKIRSIRYYTISVWAANAKKSENEKGGIEWVVGPLGKNFNDITRRRDLLYIWSRTHFRGRGNCSKIYEITAFGRTENQISGAAVDMEQLIRKTPGIRFMRSENATSRRLPTLSD